MYLGLFRTMHFGSFLWTCSHLLNKFLLGNLIFCAVQCREFQDEIRISHLKIFCEKAALKICKYYQEIILFKTLSTNACETSMTELFEKLVTYPTMLKEY